MFFHKKTGEKSTDNHKNWGAKTYPISTKSTSDITIMNNPTQITPMTPASVQVGRSSLNANANIRTKARDEDLHMAKIGVATGKKVILSAH